MLISPMLKRMWIHQLTHTLIFGAMVGLVFIVTVTVEDRFIKNLISWVILVLVGVPLVALIIRNLVRDFRSMEP
jgi:nitrate/nitrite transporter NarK